MASQNSLKNFDPAISQGFPVNLANLDTDGALNGQVITYSSLQNSWVPGSGGGGGGMTIGEAIGGGTAKEVLYTDNSGDLFSDSGFTRDSSTLETQILRQYTNGASEDVETGFKTLSDIGTGFPGSFLRWSDTAGNQVNMGTIDGEGFGIDTGLFLTQATDAAGNSNSITGYAQGGQWLLENNVGANAQIGMAATNINLLLNNGGVGDDDYGFKLSGENVEWTKGGMDYRLPSGTPSIGQVISVDSISGSNVNLVFSDPSGGGVELGGATSLFTDNMIQFIDTGGVQGGSSLFTWQSDISAFIAQNNFASFMRPIVFTGGGLDDMTNGGTYTGQYTRTVKIEIDSALTTVEYNNSTGGNINYGDNVTFSVSGAIGQVYANNFTDEIAVYITNGISPTAGDVIDNGAGQTVDYVSTISVVDTFSYFIDDVLQLARIEITGAPQIPDDGMFIEFASLNSHTIGNYWTFDAVQYQDTQLTNRFNLSSIFGGVDAYVTGSVFENGAEGIVSYNGLFQTPGSGIIPLPTLGFGRSTTGESYSAGFEPNGVNDYLWSTSITNGSSITSGFIQTANGFQFSSDGTFSVRRNNEDELFRVESNDGIIKAGDILNDTTLMEINLDDNTIEFNTTGRFEINSDGNQFFNLDGSDATLGDIADGFGGLGILTFDNDNQISWWGDSDNSGTGAIIRLDRLNGIIEGIASAQMLWSSSGSIGLTAPIINISGAVSTPTMETSTGGGHTMAAGYAGLYYDPASVEATATIDLPASPVDGQETTIYFGGTITTGNPVIAALTLNAGANSIIGNVPPGADSGNVLKFKYRTANTTWYRDN